MAAVEEVARTTVCWASKTELPGSPAVGALTRRIGWTNLPLAASAHDGGERANRHASGADEDGAARPGQ